MDADEPFGTVRRGASRVMEIEEVLVPRIVSGFSSGKSSAKILTFVASFSTRRFDHQIAVGELLEVGRRSDP